MIVDRVFSWGRMAAPSIVSLCILAGLGLPESLAQPAPGGLIISEFMAANASGKQDEDGERSDWIEIYNPTSEAVSLANWSLTDDSSNVGRWRFPSVTIAPRGFLLVFASGKNRTNALEELHTNFSLSREGEYLALAAADGSVVHEYAPAYPAQVADVSFGVAMVTELDLLVPQEAAGRFFAPSDGTLASQWAQPGFGDGLWRAVTTPVGYDRIPPGSNDPSEPPSALGDVTTPGDAIIGTSNNSPGNETVINSIDNADFTKYLNFDKLNTGFTVSPSRGLSVVSGLRLTSANDAQERDPTSYVLSGSVNGSTFVEIASGPIPTFSARFTPVEVTFQNTNAFNHYRLIFPTVRNATSANSMQIAEVEFLGDLGGPVARFSDLIRTSVEDVMFSRRTSAYLRIPFTYTWEQPLENLRLNLRYDDGFAAYLNGVRVASANVREPIAHDQTAPTNRFRRHAVQETHWSLNAFTNLLRAGDNVLAIHGFNDRADSPEFLLAPQLENARVSLGAPAYYETPTPGGENSAPHAGIVSSPEVSHRRGLQEAPFDVSITSTTPDSSIVYTTNGANPTGTNGIIYTGPIRIDRTTTLRVAAVREGWRSSTVETYTYIFLNDVVNQTREGALAAGFPAFWGSQAADYGLDPRVVGPNDLFGGKYRQSLKTDLQSLPSMSLVMEPTDLFGSQGIYSNPEARGDTWERPASIELIYPDDRTGFQENAGIRIQGGAFRRFDLSLKKSFRLVFRERYGASRLEYPLFGPGATDDFQNFILRANSNDAWPHGGASALYTKDAFAMETLRAMGSVSSHLNYVHLYINGQYWGLYNPVERPDAAFSASYFGGDRDTWDALNQDSAPDGNYDAWNRLLAALNQDLTRNDVYQRLQGNNPDGTRNPAYEDLIDVDSLINYMILNIYVGNTDWPHRNWWAGRDRNDGDGFKFYPWDTETALNSLNQNVTGVNNAVTRPYAALRANAEFRLRFADLVHRHFFNGGAFYVNPASPAWNAAQPQNNQPAARFMALASSIKPAVVGESARWGDQLRATPYTVDQHWQPALNNLLVNYFPRRSGIVLDQLREAGLYPRTVAPAMNGPGGTVDPGFRLNLAAPAGVIYYTLNGGDPRATNNSIRYTGPIELTDLVTVRARTLNGTEWSALAEATFTTGQPFFGLSELNYHPAGTTPEEQAAGILDDNNFEFIELGNFGTATLDLTGVKFVNGIDFDFATSSITRLAPGQYLLLVNDRAAFETRYGAGLPIAGIYTGRLSNSGETVRAVNADNQTVLEFTYATERPWPQGADGGGASLEVVDPQGNLGDVTNWRDSSVRNGSPGVANPQPPVELDILGLTAAEIRLGFNGRVGQGYTLLATESLTTPNWQVVQSGNPLAQNQRVELVIPATQARARFYRVSIP